MPPTKRSVKDFLPLIVLFSLIIAFTAFMQYRLGAWDTLYAMQHFEGAFFILFGAFKLLNWKGFVDAYMTYDIVAKHFRIWGWAYPIVELLLGVAFLMGTAVLEASIATLIIMLIGSIGVFQALRRKGEIPCACLGVVFKIPMTWVTLTEDLLMATMAGAMIIMLM